MTNALDGESLPVYGDGMQIRDWIYVTDHCEGIWTALERGVAGQVYNVGGGNEVPNIEITQRILALTGADASLIRYVTDRPGPRPALLDRDGQAAWPWAGRRRWSSTPALAETVAWYREQRDVVGADQERRVPGVLRDAVRRALSWTTTGTPVGDGTVEPC